VNIAVYAAPEQDAREIAGEVLKELQHVYESEEVSLANGQVLV
jgi:hypothetical protein